MRAARIMRVLRDPSWNWFGLILFYTMFALLGLAVVALTSTVGAIDHAVRWTAAAVVFPGGLTLLNFLHQVRRLDNAADNFRDVLGIFEVVFDRHICCFHEKSLICRDKKESVGSAFGNGQLVVLNHRSNGFSRFFA